MWVILQVQVILIHCTIHQHQAPHPQAHVGDVEGRLARTRERLAAVTEELNACRVREDFGRLARQFTIEAKDERIGALVRQVEGLERRTREDKLVILDMERCAGARARQVQVLRSRLAAATRLATLNLAQLAARTGDGAETGAGASGNLTKLS